MAALEVSSKSRRQSEPGVSARERTRSRAVEHVEGKTARRVPADEASFLRKYRPADFPRPSVTVDIVAFSIIDAELRVLLVQRGEHPFKGAWALPGGFVRVGDGHRDQGEDLDAAAARELQEETNLSPMDVPLEQVAAFGRAGRDPRLRVISVAFCALIRPDLVPLVRAGGDATHADWFPVNGLVQEKLAFDHAAIIERSIEHVAARLDASSIAASLVPVTFTIQELRHVYALLSGKPQDPGNFRRKFERMLEDGVIERAPGKRLTASKPALVYRFMRHKLAGTVRRRS
jgi:8-oxo-dGTP diphosphatase